MFLFHPRVAGLLNTKSLVSAFSAGGLSGNLEHTLHAQQANPMLAFGHHCQASSGGTASLCGGAAGPGAGMAGASGAPFSGAAAVTAGGSNGAAGGVPMGGQDVGRYCSRANRFSPYLLDDQDEVAAIDATGESSLMAARFAGGSDPAAKGRASGLSSVDSLSQNNMYHASTYYGNSAPRPKKGGPTCPNPPSGKKK